MLNNIMQMYMNGMLEKNQDFRTFKKFFIGKSPQEQLQTFLNMQESRGVDIHEKKFTAEQLRQAGIKLPPTAQG